MANSRKSRSPNREGGIAAAYERALGAILARVAVSGPALRIGIAFSGGLDSSVLLELASRHAAAHNLALTAFHVHHGLSPNADAWMGQCGREAVACGVPMLSRNVAVVDPGGRGVE